MTGWLELVSQMGGIGRSDAEKSFHTLDALEKSGDIQVSRVPRAIGTRELTQRWQNRSLKKQQLHF